ncbi:MAG: BON domain-containing protein [Acidobacteria bacterium]|nr:BON domain-containing protein [Acidobacteriota bacterium]
MRKAIVVMILVVLLAGGGYYVYKNGWHWPSSPSALFSADADTANKVKDSFRFSKRLSGFNINVASNSGKVVLTGQLPSESLKALAGEIASDTRGVSEVKNDIAVDPAAQPSIENARIDDLEIRAAILEAFARSPELGGKSIDVKVENKMVTLAGTVDTPAQKSGAEQTVRAVDGVAGVANNLAVTNPQATAEPSAMASQKPSETTADLAKTVEFELFRTGAFDTTKMKITAAGDSVTLAGTARSKAEQLLAEKIAQSIHGVNKVVNELKVVAPLPPTKK